MGCDKGYVRDEMSRTSEDQKLEGKTGIAFDSDRYVDKRVDLQRS